MRRRVACTDNDNTASNSRLSNSKKKIPYPFWFGTCVATRVTAGVENKAKTRTNHMSGEKKQQ